MKLQSRKLFFAIAPILFFSVIAFSQDLRKQAEEHPLSTVLYLLSTTDKDSKEEEKACLAKSFVRAERFGEIENAVKMVEGDSYVDENFVALVNELIANGKIDEASKLASVLIKKFGNDEYSLQMILKPLVRLKRDDEALQIIDKFDDSDKIDGAIELAEIYFQMKQPAKALSVIESVKNLVEKSEYDEDKANLGLSYAKLGKESEALYFLREAMKNLIWKTGKPEYLEGRIIDRVVEIYRSLGKHKEADDLLTRQGTIEESQTQIEIAQAFLAEGNIQKAKEIYEKTLNQLNPKDYSDSFDVGNLIKIYIKLGEIKKAEKIAKSLTGSYYMQQSQLLNLADFYVKKKNKPKAFELLNFALQQTRKIDTSEAESGQLWTSGKWDQAQYQSQIAVRLINMRFDAEALRLISQITKPYLKALILTEFVSVNKNRISAKKLSVYLEEALLLLRREKTDIFDSKRYDVYAIAARNFAEIGMKEKSVDVFAETLTSLDKLMIESGSDSSLLFAMCNIGVEFEKSKIKPNEKLKASLKNIIKNWENDEY